MQVRNLHIGIPRRTSLELYGPPWVVELYRAKWAGKTLNDQPITARPVPDKPELLGVKYSEVLSAENELGRLISQFGEDTFRKVYPTDEDFIKRVEEVMEIEGHTLPRRIATPEEKQAAESRNVLAGLPGIDTERLAKLIELGLDSLEAVAFADDKALRRDLTLDAAGVKKLKAEAAKRLKAQAAPAPAKAD